MFREFIDRVFKKKYDDVTRRKINYIYQVILDFHERKSRNSIDIPAFVYATRDIKKILKKHTINEAYTLTKDYVKRKFEGARNGI